MKRITLQRKGQLLQGKTKVIIISLMICLILAIIIANISNWANNASKNMQCYDSVRAAAALRYRGVALVENINCPTKEVKVADSNPEKIKLKVATEMATCYNNFGNGAKDVFANSDEKFCVICSRVQFNKKNIRAGGFAKFLAENRVPRKEDTFMEFLAPQTNIDDRANEIESMSDDYIDTNKDYAVVFVYDKIAHMDSLTGTKLGAGIGASVGTAGGILLVASGIVSGGTIPAIIIGVGVVGGIIGGTTTGDPPEYARVTVLWPYEDIEKLECTYMPGEQGNIK